MERRLAASIVVAALVLPGLAASGAAADRCGGPGGETATVAAVEPGLELRLADGRRIRLPGIDAARPTPDRPGLGEEARRSLAGWLEGRAILLRPSTTGPDRWNRTVGDVYAGTGPIEPAVPPALPLLSVAEALVDAGWARARAEAAAHACFSRLLARERDALAAGLGLWADRHYAILDPNDGAAFAGQAGGLAIVEGVIRLRTDRARFRLAFEGAPRGIEATVVRHAAKAFARAGLAIESLAGARVRVRGFLDDRFGPRIDLTDPDQVERIDANVTPAPSSEAPADGHGGSRL